MRRGAFREWHHWRLIMAARSIKTLIDQPNGRIVWSFPESHLDDVVLDVSKVSEGIKAYAVFHGLKQRAADNAADAKTDGARRAALLEMVTHLTTSDVWNRKIVHAPKVLDVGAVITAMCNVLTAGDLDRAERLIATTMTKRNIDRTAAAQVWADTPEVGGEMARLERAKKPTTASAKDMLAEMDAAE
jgi:hypothetical protein